MASMKDGKKSDKGVSMMLVVAGALAGQDGRWLMHKRPFDKHHGGLWEFPGGKVEPQEAPVFALVRELEEELGISVQPEDCRAAVFADQGKSANQTPIVILLYTIAQWEGEPQALEGEEIRWFLPEEIQQLDRPPLDIVLARRLFEKA